MSPDGDVYSETLFDAQLAAALTIPARYLPNGMPYDMVLGGRSLSAPQLLASTLSSKPQAPSSRRTWRRRWT